MIINAIILIAPLKRSPATDDRDENDVGCDPKDAKAGEEEGGHLLVIGADELDLGLRDVLHTSWSS